VKELNLAVVGVGNWGANLLRNLTAIENVTLRWLCDLDPQVLRRCHRAHPGAAATTRIEEVLADDAVEAVAIATPAETHYACGLAALRAGKHVFVE
jgi:predicted dehydrogenase